MSVLHLKIVTPDKIVLSSDADYIGARGTEGDFGVLPHHTPMLSALDIGILHFELNNVKHYAFISDGFLEVSDNNVTVLAQSAELAKDIDTARAEKAKTRAQSFIDSPEKNVDRQRAIKALQRAEIRLKIAAFKHNN